MNEPSYDVDFTVTTRASPADDPHDRRSFSSQSSKRLTGTLEPPKNGLSPKIIVLLDNYEPMNGILKNQLCGFV